MRGSGIYSQDVYYDGFLCENEDCNQLNTDGETTTDDWGAYVVECKFCGVIYYAGSLSNNNADEGNQWEE